MKALIVYYSLSGNNRIVATELARDLGADVEELSCGRYSPGVWGSMRAVYDSLKGRLPPIGPLAHKITQYDLVVIAGPVWASHPAAPVRTFLHKDQIGLPLFAFLMTQGGSGGERALREMETIVGRAPVATLLVNDRDIKAQTFASRLPTFAAKLRKAAGAA